MSTNQKANNNHKADMVNANKGVKGQNQGNRGKQLNPNNKTK